MILSTAVAGGFGVRELVSTPIPGMKAFVLLALAGGLNGFAIYVHTSRVSDPSIPTSVFLTMIFAFMVLLSPILSWLINSEPISLTRAMGMLTIVVGIIIMAL